MTLERMPTDPLNAKRKRAARQHRYYMRNRETLLEKSRSSYDPEKRAEHYRENHKAVRQAARLRYLCQRGDEVKRELEEMANTSENDSTRKVILAMINNGRHLEFTHRDIRTLYNTLDFYPPPVPPAPLLDKCDEAVISLRQ
jgi:hypothetical protein